MRAAATLSVVSHGHGPLLEALLDDLTRQQGISALRVIVTLNVPEPAISADRWPSLKLLLRHNAAPLGFGANHNAAFAQAEGDWFLVVNPDIRLPDDTTLETLLALPAEGVGVVGPQVLSPNGEIEDSVRGPLTLPRLLRRHGGSSERTPAAGEFFWLAGMLLVFRSHAYAAVNGFDERFFLYCEDFDICARLRLKGLHVVHHEAVSVVHAAQRDSRRKLRHLRLHVISLLKVWLSAAFWRLCLRGWR
jgi:N-acetylglucosaminyl-diphospho-decaprenol L-rhamnosyltransferase